MLGPTFELPRALERPIICSDSISRLTLDALAPELAELPLPFIHHQLALHTEQMLAGLEDLQVPGTIPHFLLPPTLAIALPHNCSNVELIYPTHVLAVSVPSRKSDEPFALIPVHGIVVAAYCSAAVLHPAPSEDVCCPPDTLTLPVCPVVLPSVQAFITLREYMYSQRIDTLFAALFPLPAPLAHTEVKTALASAATKLRLATHLICAHPGLAHLFGYAARVQEVWKTACCLGMYDAALWDALDLAWELVIVALNLAVDAQETV